MKEIKEIIYVPTLRCNYKCLHCGQKRFINKDEEIACDNIANAIEKLDLNGCEIYITGGEPFLKDDLSDFVLKVTNNNKYTAKISITTNGYFTDKIIDLISKVENKNRLSFSISIDGIGETHNNIRGNSNAYKRAIKTVKKISELGVKVSVNTVIQRNNVIELDNIKEIFEKEFNNKVEHNFIPEIADISMDKEFQFSDNEVREILRFTKYPKDVKYLLEKGDFRIKECHAGLKNFVISPTGKIYTCLTGFSYFSEVENNEYYIGNLKKENIDKILEKNEEVYSMSVKKCKGCNNPCEIFREEKYFDFKYDINSRNADIVLSGENIPEYYLDTNWYPIESINGDKFQWMSNKTSSIFFKCKFEVLNNIEISIYNGYKNTSEKYSISFFINDKFYNKFELNIGINSCYIKFDEAIKFNEVVKITIKVDYLWNEFNDANSKNGRKLGVSFRGIKFNSNSQVCNDYNFNEEEIREKIKLAISNIKREDGINVKRIVEKIRRELGDSETFDIYKECESTFKSVKDEVIEKKLSLWYKILKQINLKLRKMTCYDRYILPIVECIKRKVPQSFKYQNKLNYKDLLYGNNYEFIYNAYSKILLRIPDENGIENCINMLIEEKGDRILVLGSIRYSIEGKEKNISISGLNFRYKLKRIIKIIYKIPIIGYILRMMKDMVTLPKKFETIFKNIVQKQIFEEEIYNNLNGMNKDLSNKLNLIDEELSNKLNLMDEGLSNRLNELTQRNIKVDKNINKFIDFKRKFDEAEEKQNNEIAKQKIIKSEFDKVYVKFEDEFRGERNEIKNRLKQYIPIIQNVDIKNNHDHTNVIDLGCGRGEWLELLRENRFIYTGVDSNESMVDTCNKLNLNAVHEDAISYLSKLEDSSVYVITGFQIVEHIGTENIIALLLESNRVLKSGGIAIFETPNPENIIVGACNFYLDSTHNKPIPPTQLQFFAKSCGFDRVDILRLNPYNAIDISKFDTKNEEIIKMANFFNNMTDYSILAYKE